MKNFAKNTLTYFFLLFISFFLGCKKCEPYRSEGFLSENQKAFISSQKEDILNFEDSAGNKHLLRCSTKDIRYDGYGHTGHDNPCDDMYISMEYLETNFEGNLFSDNKEAINLQIKIGGKHDEENAIIDNCKTTNQLNTAFRFSTIYGSQTIYGGINETGSQIRNFHFKPIITLNGKAYHDVNMVSIENPGIETVCQPIKNSNVGVDSIYFSTQHGLIRLTTVGGKKYQRVL